MLGGGGIQHFVTGVCVKIEGGSSILLQLYELKVRGGSKRIVVLLNRDPRFIISLYS